MKQHSKVDLILAQKAIDQAEVSSQNFSSMCASAANLYNSWTSPAVTAAILRLRLTRDNVLTTNIKPAERKARSKKTPKELKEKQDKVLKTNPEAMIKLHPGRERWVEAALKGSRKAAIFLKCFDCSCNQPIEIKMCRNSDCSLFPFRPYI